MENFDIKDLIRLIEFYKNKSSDLEFEFLKLQINSKKEQEIEIARALGIQKQKTEEMSQNYGRIIDDLQKKMGYVDKSIKTKKRTTTTKALKTKP